MKKFFALFIMLCSCSAAFAGEALVTLNAPDDLTDYEAFTAKVAEAVGAEVVTVYGALSTANTGRVFAFLRSGTKDTPELLRDLKAHPDVLSASPNRKVRINKRRISE